MMENTVPGANQYSGQGAKDLTLSGANRLSPPEKNTKTEYGTSAPKKLLNSAGAAGDPSAARFNRQWHHAAQEGDLKNVEFRTRDFDGWDRLGVAYRQLFETSDKSPFGQLALLAAFPSHHQKMVLIDYESPADAVGFVMGHNMHNNYWDTNAHLYDDEQALRVAGFGPWQDLSTMVRGSVLYDLNTNFVKAWDVGSPWYKRWFDSLKGDREKIQPSDFVTQPSAMNCMAQICRTQPQESGEQSIKELYMLAAGNARKYIYAENQYFRFEPWAEKLKETRKALTAGGKDENTHGVCHIFVVTNVPDDTGRMNTHRMLKALHQVGRMPQVEKELTLPKSQHNDVVVFAQKPIPGLKMHVCTLISSTGKATQNQYRPIYVHSKLLVVDDVFFTLGSANINTRSMEVDSELNIASDNPELAQTWRKQLFALHTGSAPSDDPAIEFERWDSLIAENLDNANNQKPIIGKLIPFFDGGGVTTTLD
jgi:phosphatidylserine/phosphatidylglycerophosphate/cardiolipin synthase-like enzyme